MKYLYITHLSGKRVNRLWLSALNAARSLGHEIHLACNMDEIVKPEWDADCLQYEITAHQIDFDRNPLASKNKKAYRQLFALMKKENFDLVHCNTPIGGVLGRICAVKAKVPSVIYQAHGFHFYKGAPLKNWLFYYPVERYLARYTDVLITINQEDFLLAKKFVLRKGGQVEFVPGVGVDTKKIADLQTNKEQKKRELGIAKESIVFITVGELIPRKNHATLIQAFKKANLPKSILLICGGGTERKNLQRQISEQYQDGKVLLLGFREDVTELLKVADVFVLPSLQEGLPVALMEAMAAGLPCVASRIRGNTDLLGNDYKYYFEPAQSDELAAMLTAICADRSACGQYCYERSKLFDICVVAEQMKTIYCKTLK